MFIVCVISKFNQQALKVKDERQRNELYMSKVLQRCTE